MAKKSKRGSGPRPGSNRAERIAARKARQEASLAPPARPFEGLAAECDLVAMRTFIASATAAVPFAAAAGATRSAEVVTILPGAVQALPGDGDRPARVAVQTQSEPADLTATLADALSWAGTDGAGEFRAASRAAALTDVLDADATLDIEVHRDFSWWFAGGGVPAELRAMVDRADQTIMPTARLTPASGVGAPWWVDAGDRAHLRWVRPEAEEELMTALTRVHAAGGLTLGEGSRFAGSFRTHGLIVPVFDLDNELHPEEWTAGLAALDERITEALAATAPLTAAERGSRAGLIARQVTLR